MSLFIINKATNTNKGSGLPFYKKIDYVFSKLNNGFNSSEGLFRVPNNKVPVFQLWIPEDIILELKYLETKGNNNLTGNTFTPTGFGGPVIKAVKDDGVNKFIIYTSDAGTLITPAPNGRWIIKLTMKKTGGAEQIYYSEEFLTTPCCE